MTAIIFTNDKLFLDEIGKRCSRSISRDKDLPARIKLQMSSVTIYGKRIVNSDAGTDYLRYLFEKLNHPSFLAKFLGDHLGY